GRRGAAEVFLLLPAVAGVVAPRVLVQAQGLVEPVGERLRHGRVSDGVAVGVGGREGHGEGRRVGCHRPVGDRRQGRRAVGGGGDGDLERLGVAAAVAVAGGGQRDEGAGVAGVRRDGELASGDGEGDRDGGVGRVPEGRGVGVGGGAERGDEDAVEG